MRTPFRRIILVAVAAATLVGPALAFPAAAQPAHPRASAVAALPKGPDGKPVMAVAKRVTMTPARTPDAVWREGAVSPAYSTYWDLNDGALYASYKFAVYLEGQSGMVSDSTRHICVNSVLTHIDANDGTYYIRLHNEFTPSARSSGYSGYVAFPVVLNAQYGFCFTSLPDYDRGDVYTVQFSKKNTTHYYSGHIIATR